ncbi:hypothetical protein [Paraburkholderia sacchari]
MELVGDAIRIGQTHGCELRTGHQRTLGCFQKGNIVASLLA